MKDRRLYWRKKGKSIVLEGRLDNNSPILIWTLPEANRFIKLINEKASLFEQEKLKEINEKVMRLAFRPQKIRKQRQEVQSISLNRTTNLDAEPTAEEIEASLKESKDKTSLT